LVEILQNLWFNMNIEILKSYIILYYFLCDFFSMEFVLKVESAKKSIKIKEIKQVYRYIFRKSKYK